MKFIVETTGDFMQINPITGEVVEPDRPCVVSSNGALQNQIAIGNLRILDAELPDTANDEEFLTFIKSSDHDLELARASYIAHLAVGEVVAETAEVEAEAKKTGRGSRS